MNEYSDCKECVSNGLSIPEKRGVVSHNSGIDWFRMGPIYASLLV